MIRFSDLEKDLQNIVKVDRAFSEWTLGTFDLVKFSCYNESEAVFMKSYAKRKYPGMLVQFSWIDWRPEYRKGE